MTTRVAHARQRRLALGMTQQALARRAEVTVAAVRDLENGVAVTWTDRAKIMGALRTAEKTVLMRAADIMRTRDDR